MGRLGRLAEGGTGQVGGRYRLLERLGTGGMSVVWRGYDEILGREVAVKVLSAQLAEDRTFRERLRQEALSAARLCHPHITGIFDYGESPVGAVHAGGADEREVVVPYVVMELNDGESLSHRLTRRGPLSWHDAVTMAAEVASALAAAHARGVVHRDVTPANVMLTSAGAKVVDFGISALIGERDTTPDGSLLGTPAYLAPERLTGGQVSPATDVYALGLLLYRALTGRLPWPAETTAEALRAHLYADPEPIPSQTGMPASVAELCLSCLAKVPADRPAATAVAHTLAVAAGRSPVPSVAVPVDQPVSPPPAGPRLLAPAGPALPAAVGGRPPIARPVREPARQPVGEGRVRRVLRAGHRRVHTAAAAVTLFTVLAVLVVALGSSEEPGEIGPAQAAAVGAGGVVEHPTRCRVRYQMRRDTGATFDVSLAVTIVGQQPVENPLLEFTFPGNQRLTSLTGPVGQSEQLGRSVAVRLADGAVLQPGQPLEIFLHGAYEHVNPLPVTFTVDGLACAATVYGTPVTPSPGGERAILADDDTPHHDAPDDSAGVRSAADVREPARTSVTPNRSRAVGSRRAPKSGPPAGGAAAGQHPGGGRIGQSTGPSEPAGDREPPGLRIRPQHGFAV